MSYIPREYIQKSKHFLFPLLGFKNNEIILPENTYLYWNGSESVENYELIVHYRNTLGQLYEDYERRSILRNPNLSGCYTIDDGNVFIFDLMEYADDVNHFLEGNYSKIHRKTQRIIRTFNFDMDDLRMPKEGRYFHMVFNPDVYYSVVSQELDIPIKDLEKGVELCPKFDKNRETLSVNILKKGECSNIKQLSSMQLEFKK